MEEDKEKLRERLTEEQYKVTQEGGTEAPFTGKYYKTKTPGMYRCAVCGAELFDSKTKFDSYSGWPSFYDVVKSDAVGIREDHSHGMVRKEAFCKNCGAHLGHLFDDAPETPTGQRYCINSASLDLEEREEKEESKE